MFGGSMVAVVTPMGVGGEIDWAAWEKLVDFHATQGTDALVVGGTTGESATLSDAEVARLIESAIRVLRGRMPVIAGAASNSTAVAAERAREISATGADALLVVTPYYNKPTQGGLFEHFSVVARASSVPVILYNVPSRTAVDLQAETVAKLARVPNIVAIKEATGSVERAQAIRAAAPAEFEIYSGDDATAVELMAAGARGVISVTANVAPRQMHAVCAAAAAGDLARARDLDGKLRELHQVLFVESNPIPSKWALHQMGLIPPGLRLPLTPLEPRNHATVHGALKRAGLLS
ncbi:MAG TPA: 4-hydroxy-tetrahydrodipicolinate synthase [Steroidobacteraceae bacterium]|nr:4-hydroxy-tetrahydrodipicolinate synthase [Steroidobacteraceae bacterium]